MSFSIKGIASSFVCALLIGLSAWVAIPVEPVPITMQLTVIFMIGILMSVYYAGLSVFLYILMGALGIPLFSGGRSGIDVLTGATGGYLIGFLVGAVVISHLSKEIRDRFYNGNKVRNYLAIMWPCAVGAIIILIFGVGWGKYSTELPWPEIFEKWLYPFLPGLLVKMVIAVLLSVWMLKRKWMIK